MTTEPLGIIYVADETVDRVLDQKIRELLVCCFTKPQDRVFETRRYFREPYPHRWIITNQSGFLVAHIGVHEKKIRANSREYRIGGIAEVCVHPEYRGRGLVRKMLGTIHEWLVANGFSFAVLMGDPDVYRSSGYRTVDNLYCRDEAGGKDDGWMLLSSAMVCPMSDLLWPNGKVLLSGPPF